MTAWALFPAAALFALPVADTRAPASSVTLRWGEAFAIDAALGVSFPVVEAAAGPCRAQAGLAAAGFMGFQPTAELTFDLQTFDGLVAVPVDVRRGRWAARLQWAHVSAHYGDGVRNDDARPDVTTRYSREWVQLQGGPELGPARVYAGARAILHATEAVAPFAVQLGGEVEGPWKVAPFLAVDVQAAGEDGWTPAVAGQLGARVRVGARRLRVAATGRAGPDDTGRLHPAEERYVGVVVGFDSGIRWPDDAPPRPPAPPPPGPDGL